MKKGITGAFRERLADAFGVPVVHPKNFEVANAIGAALAKTTIDIELFEPAMQPANYCGNARLNQRFRIGHCLLRQSFQTGASPLLFTDHPAVP